MAKYKLTQKNVNSKFIFKPVNEFIVDGIETAGIMWKGESHRQSFVEVIAEYLNYEFQEVGKISQIDVRCDNRNNKSSEMDNGHFVLDVRFRQKHCLNITHLRYDIYDSDEDDLTMEFFF